MLENFLFINLSVASKFKFSTPIFLHPDGVTSKGLHHQVAKIGELKLDKIK